MIRGIRRGLVGFFAADAGPIVPVFGFAVRLHPTVLLLALALAARQPSAAWALAAIGLGGFSLIAHELAHAFVAARWAVVYRIELHGAGGHTLWRPLTPLEWWRPLIVALAGPAGGCAVALAAWGVGNLPGLPASGIVVLEVLVALNLGWSLLNLVPARPLDGGVALGILLVRRFGETGRAAGEAIGAVAGSGLVLFGIGMGESWMAVLGGWLAVVNGQKVVARVEAWRDAHRHTQWARPEAAEADRDRYR